PDRAALLRAHGRHQPRVGRALRDRVPRPVAAAAPTRAGLAVVDPRLPDPRGLPADEQGLLAPVRSVAAAVVRARAARPPPVRAVRGRRRRGLPHAVLVVRPVLEPRGAPDRRVRDRRAGPLCRLADLSCGVGPPAGARTGRPSPGAGPGGRALVKPETRAGLLDTLKVFAAVRIGLLVLGLASVALVPLVPPLRPVSVPGWHSLFTAWERFDGLWFLRIAAEGYRSSDGSAAFFPLYPLLTRAVSFLIGHHPFAAALIVSNASFAGALCALYLLTASDRSEPVARTTVLFLAVFPTAFFFFAPYSESLFLLLAVTAFWGARTRRWAVAGAAGALAALTRNVGI